MAYAYYKKSFLAFSAADTALYGTHVTAACMQLHMCNVHSYGYSTILAIVICWDPHEQLAVIILDMLYILFSALAPRVLQ